MKHKIYAIITMNKIKFDLKIYQFLKYKFVFIWHSDPVIYIEKIID